MDLLDELRALDPALQQGVDHHDVGAELADLLDRPAAVGEHVEQLDRLLGVQQAADVLGDLRHVLDDQEARLVAARAARHGARRYHGAPHAARVGTRRPDQARSAMRTARSAPGPIGAEVVATRHQLDPQPGVLGEARAARRRDTRRRRSWRIQRVAGPPCGRLVEDRRQRDRAGRRVVDGGAGLRHERRRSRDPCADPLEDEPTVEPAEVVGIGQPHVDGGEAARREVGGERLEGLALGGAGGQQHDRVERDEREGVATGIRAAGVQEVGLDELEPLARRGPRPRPGRGPGASIAGSRSTPVTRWPATASGTASRPLPAASSRTGPSARSASARYRSRSPGSSCRSRSYRRASALAVAGSGRFDQPAAGSQRTVPPGRLAHGEGADRLERRAVRRHRRRLGVVVRRRHLDDVHPGELDRTDDLADGPQDLAGQHPAGFRRAGAGRQARVDDVDVEAQVDAVGPVERLVDGLGDDRLGAALLDLAHEVVAQALLLHPCERLDRRPVAAQSDLDEVAAVDRARFDRGGASACRGRRGRPSRRSRCRRGRRNGRCRCCPGGGPRRPPIADGQVIEWSPPRMIGMAPVSATSRTFR